MELAPNIVKLLHIESLKLEVFCHPEGCTEEFRRVCGSYTVGYFLLQSSLIPLSFQCFCLSD